jgi:pantoate--beta-alanine ligase
MQIFHHINEWVEVRQSLSHDLPLGFVPTMGNLHLGHASLVRASQQDNEQTLVSIFVNPTQFNRVDDFTHYPRTLEDDLNLLQQAGVDYCLIPDKSSIYPNDYHYQVQENHDSLTLEGLHRPGHFTGVLTVVMKLFNLVKPQRAYFGEKDYQQLQLIRNMVKEFFMDIEIKACPTIREASQLAYSSRNKRLNEHQRTIADQFAQIFHQKAPSREQLLNELHQLDLDVEYLEEQQGRRFIAVNIGGIRLIDNYAYAK